jgi:prevent-host-death family protein
MAMYGHNPCMIKVPVNQAKTQLTKLLPMVEAGERVVITRHGKPVAEIVTYKEKKGGLQLDRIVEIRKELGMSLEPGWIAEDFDAPLTDDDLNLNDPNDPLYSREP